VPSIPYLDQANLSLPASAGKQWPSSTSHQVSQSEAPRRVGIDTPLPQQSANLNITRAVRRQHHLRKPHLTSVRHPGLRNRRAKVLIRRGPHHVRIPHSSQIAAKPASWPGLRNPVQCSNGRLPPPTFSRCWTSASRQATALLRKPSPGQDEGLVAICPFEMPHQELRLLFHYPF
jgi:hypothetical protein